MILKKFYTVLIIFCSILLCSPVNAQKEGNIWYFGSRAGLDFNSGSPVLIKNSVMSTYEGCATICDSFGNLLFYTDGLTVFNKNHVAMPNGTGLKGHSSSSQSAVIVKKPGTKDVYVIATVDYQGQSDGLQYSEVDMSLQGSLGDVNSVKNVKLVSSTCEKVTIVRHSNGRDFWIVTHLYDSDKFHSYLLTSTGVNSTPVVTTIGATVTFDRTRTIGYLKASRDGKRIAIAHSRLDKVELFDFDNSSGRLSNLISFGNFSHNISPYGIEFSPNNKLLYVGEFRHLDSSKVHQYNLDAGSNTDIINSRVSFGRKGGGGAIQLGPDNKIYQCHFNEFYLGVINYPNKVGSACGYVSDAINLGDRKCLWGLPTFINSFVVYPTFSFDKLCFGDSTLFSLSSTEIVDSVKWDFGDPSTMSKNASTDTMPTHVFSKEGTYKVTLVNFYGKLSDTLDQKVTITRLSVYLGKDTTLCAGESLLLKSNVSEVDYLWSDNSTKDTFRVTQNGTYWLKIGKLKCSYTDSIEVNYTPLPVVSLGKDTTLCDGQSLILKPNNPNGTFLWQNNSTANSILINDPGVYWVKVTEKNCINVDSIEIKYNPLPNVNIGNDTTICFGETLELNASISNASYLWNDNSKLPKLTTLTSGMYWCEVMVNNCVSRDSINIHYMAKVEVDLGNDSILCDDATLTLSNVVQGATYEWQDNSTNSSYLVNENGFYWVEITINSCSARDSIQIDYVQSPVINPFSDTTICMGDSLTLNVENPIADYQWSDNTDSPIKYITREGEYWVRVHNICGEVQDTITVGTEKCYCYMHIPTAFTPNSDGINDVFLPMENCLYEDYELNIYDRWGELLFRTEDPYASWDGKFKGVHSPLGVYMYVIKYKFRKKKTSMKYGSVTLIR